MHSLKVTCSRSTNLKQQHLNLHQHTPNQRRTWKESNLFVSTIFTISYKQRLKKKMPAPSLKDGGDNACGQRSPNQTELNTHKENKPSCYCFRFFLLFHLNSGCVCKFATLHSKIHGLKKRTTFVQVQVVQNGLMQMPGSSVAKQTVR